MRTQFRKFGEHLGFALVLLISLFSTLAIAAAGPGYWEAKKLADSSAPYMKLLDGNKQVVATVSTAQMRSLMEVKERIESIARIDTTLLIQGDQRVNAFATNIEGRNVIAVTLGMLKLTDGNPDELAAVIGHEIGHLARNHLQESQSRDAVINVIGAIFGAVLEAKFQTKYQVQGLGLNLADLGARAVSTQFSRDQEREADGIGVEWMISAGYNPEGAARLWTKMLNRQGDSLFVFLNTHPNPSERVENVRKIAQENSGRITQLVSVSRPPPALVTASAGPGSPQSASLVAVASENTSNSAFRRGLAAFQKKDYEGARKEWGSEIGKQDPRSLYGIAAIYLKGLGVEQSNAEAMKWFQRSADAKFSPAITSIGIMYQMGWGVQRDMKKAVSLLEEAALLGDPTAEAALAPLYAFGLGTPVNHAKAKEYVERAARKGNTSGEYFLGRAYERGLTGSVDYSMAKEYFERAAAKGSMAATARLGVLYEKGLGVGKDETTAIASYRKAADAGDPSGQLYLGRAYLNGIGVERNPYQAFKLLYAAAGRGSVDAQYLLGLMYLEGNGTTKDIARGYVWLSLAEEVPAFSSDIDPQQFKRKRTEVERQMSKQQLDEARTIKATMMAKNLIAPSVQASEEKPPTPAVAQSTSKVHLNLPAGWEERALTEKMISIGVISFLTNRTTDTGAALMSAKKAGITDLMTFAASKRAAQANSLTDVQQSPVSALEINGKRAMRFDVTGILKTGQKLSYLMTLVEGDTDIAILNTWTTAAGFEQQKEAMGRLAENIAGI